MGATATKKPLTLGELRRGKGTKAERGAFGREIRRVMKAAAPLEALDAVLLLAQVMEVELDEQQALPDLLQGLMDRAGTDPRGEVALRVILARDSYRAAVLATDAKRVASAKKPRQTSLTNEDVLNWFAASTAKGEKATVEACADALGISPWLVRRLRNNVSRQ